MMINCISLCYFFFTIQEAMKCHWVFLALSILGCEVAGNHQKQWGHNTAVSSRLAFHRHFPTLPLLKGISTSSFRSIDENNQIQTSK